MKLPKFWNDTGGWNDTLVTACITLSICFWLAVAYFANAPWLYLASAILGPATGYLVGFAAVGVLCTYFAKDQRPRRRS